MDFLYNISIEIIGSFLAFLLAFFWYKNLIPEFEKLLYKGLKIDGEWKFIQDDKFADGTVPKIKRDIIVNINQKAHKLSGTAKSIAYDGTNNIVDTITYNIEGEVNDRFVLLNFISNDNKRIAYSNCLLEVVSLGSVMRGYRNFYGFKIAKVCSIKCELKRV